MRLGCIRRGFRSSSTSTQRRTTCCQPSWGPRSDSDRLTILLTPLSSGARRYGTRRTTAYRPLRSISWWCLMAPSRFVQKTMRPQAVREAGGAARHRGQHRSSSSNAAWRAGRHCASETPRMADSWRIRHSRRCSCRSCATSCFGTDRPAMPNAERSCFRLTLACSRRRPGDAASPTLKTDVRAPIDDPNKTESGE